MRHLNVIGPAVARLRFQRGWTQEALAARMQCQGDNITREVLANIESGRTQVTDGHIMAFQKAFHVRIIRLFPKPIQELDETFAGREKLRPVKESSQRRH